MKNYYELIGDNLTIGYRENGNELEICGIDEDNIKLLHIDFKNFITSFKVEEDKIIIKFADENQKTIPYSKEALCAIEKNLKFQYQIANAYLNKKRVYYISDDKIRRALYKIPYKIWCLALLLIINDSVIPVFHKAVFNLSDSKYFVISTSLYTFAFFIPEFVEAFHKQGIINDFNKYKQYYEHQRSIYNYYKSKKNIDGKEYNIHDEISKLSLSKLSKIVKNN